jgi:hypothetical protein
MSDGYYEAFLIIIGMGLAAALTAIGSIINGLMQRRNISREYAKRRLLKIELANHNEKVKKLEDKIGSFWLWRNLLSQRQRIFEIVAEFEKKIDENKIQIEDCTSIAIYLIRNKIVLGAFNDVRDQFLNFDKKQKYDMIAKLHFNLLEQLEDTTSKEFERLNTAGWSFLLKDRDTVKKIKNLTYYLEERELEGINTSIKVFQEKVDQDIEDICDRLRKEVHIKAMI